MKGVEISATCVKVVRVTLSGGVREKTLVHLAMGEFLGKGLLSSSLILEDNIKVREIAGER